MACTLRWLRKTWTAENGVTPNCDVILMGHSRGGEAAWLTGNNLANIPWWDINLEGVDVELAALVGIAPRMSTATPYNPSHAVPYLGIMGSTDEDISGHDIMSYDDMVRESQRSEKDPAKLFLWPYDMPHNAFGGNGALSLPPSSPLSQNEYNAKGIALLTTYVPSFVDLFVLGDTSSYGVFTGADLPAALTPGGNTDWWSYLEPAFSELGEGPVILRDFIVDQRNEPGARLEIDDFEEAVKFSTTMSTDAIKIGEQSDLAGDTMVQAVHRENVLRVRWGNSTPGGEIAWELDDGNPVNLAGESFFSLRIGQELVQDGDPPCGLAMGDPRANAIELSVRLEDDQAVTAEAELGPIVQQHVQEIVKPQGPIVCGRTQFMPTLRIPMSAFCATPGFDIESVVSITVEFPTLMHEVGVYMDTLEFTSATLDADGLCL
jgi:pimeloyl-ACP methyl ester carboxylesterase